MKFLILLPLLASIFSWGRRSPEEKFWEWFQENEARLFDFENDQERVFKELSDQLHKLHPSLTFEFSSKENGRREFTISADGIREAFPSVETLYSAAPALPRWKIQKFRQRHEPSGISFRGVKVEESSVFFAVRLNGQKADITIFIPDYVDSNRETFLYLAFLFLDQALGEYDVETRVGEVQVKALPENPSAVLTLRQLPFQFDSLFPGKH